MPNPVVAPPPKAPPSRARRAIVALSGSTALGAGSGIGRATALALAAKGAKVVALDVDGETAAKTAADTGGHSYQGDAADRGALDEIVAAVTANHGTPDVVINNAGVGMTGRFLDMDADDMDADDWDWIIRISYVTTKAALLALSQCLRADWHDAGAGVPVGFESRLGWWLRRVLPQAATDRAARINLGGL